MPIGFEVIHRLEIGGIDVAFNTAAATPANMDLANPTLYFSSALDFLEIPLARDTDTFGVGTAVCPQSGFHPQEWVRRVVAVGAGR